MFDELDMSDFFDFDTVRTFRVKTVTETSVDFVKTLLISGRNVECNIQTPQPERLTTDQLVQSQAYRAVYSEERLLNGEYIEVDGKDYKIINDDNWSLYGYSVALAEATNRPLLVENS